VLCQYKYTPTVEYALTRAVQVAAGVVLSVIISHTLWPFRANFEINKMLAKILSEISSLYRANCNAFIGGHALGPAEMRRSDVILTMLKVVKAKIAEADTWHKGPYAKDESIDKVYHILRQLLEEMVAMQRIVSAAAPPIHKVPTPPTNPFTWLRASADKEEGLCKKLHDVTAAVSAAMASQSKAIRHDVAAAVAFAELLSQQEDVDEEYRSLRAERHAAEGGGEVQAEVGELTRAHCFLYLLHLVVKRMVALQRVIERTDFEVATS
jgi:hypothetical protein